jgi:hypothetical protein
MNFFTYTGLIGLRAGTVSFVSMEILQIKGNVITSCVSFVSDFPGRSLEEKTYFRVEVLWKPVDKKGIFSIKTDKFGEMACL